MKIYFSLPLLLTTYQYYVTYVKYILQYFPLSIVGNNMDSTIFPTIIVGNIMDSTIFPTIIVGKIVESNTRTS